MNSKELWPEFNPDEFEIETDCTAKGDFDGAKGIPDKSSTQLSDSESDIVSKTKSYADGKIKNASEVLKDKEDVINELQVDIIKNRFADMPANLETQLGIYMNDFNNKGANLHSQFLLSKKAYNSFKSNNRLQRNYVHKSNIRKIISLLIISTTSSI